MFDPGSKKKVNSKAEASRRVARWAENAVPRSRVSVREVYGDGTLILFVLPVSTRNVVVRKRLEDITESDVRNAVRRPPVVLVGTLATLSIGIAKKYRRLDILAGILLLGSGAFLIAHSWRLGWRQQQRDDNLHRSSLTRRRRGGGATPFGSMLRGGCPCCEAYTLE